MKMKVMKSAVGIVLFNPSVKWILIFFFLSLDYFDCAWEIQAQRELMGMKKFNASCINTIAKKCFFFRDPNDRFAATNGSYCGKAASAAAAFVVSS